MEDEASDTVPLFYTNFEKSFLIVLKLISLYLIQVFEDLLSKSDIMQDATT